jgi:hypothetical protein
MFTEKYAIQVHYSDLNRIKKSFIYIISPKILPCIHINTILPITITDEEIDKLLVLL